MTNIFVWSLRPVEMEISQLMWNAMQNCRYGIGIDKIRGSDRDQAPGECLRLVLMSAAHCPNGVTFQVPATILYRSAVKHMTTAPHDQFVAPQERTIGAGFAAQGRTGQSLQRAALDSASAARCRCLLAFARSIHTLYWHATCFID